MSPPALAPEEGGDGVCGLLCVDCDGTVCGANEVCCFQAGTEGCLALANCTSGGIQYCDGPEDCGTGEICCHTPPAGYAECEQTCPGITVCNTDDYCANEGPAGSIYCCPVMNGIFNACRPNPC